MDKKFGSDNTSGDEGMVSAAAVIEQYRSFPRPFVLLVLREMFARGLMDPQKTDDLEYLCSVILAHHDKVAPDIEMQIAMHSHFLNVAEYALDIDQPAVAVVLVAVAIEHILNLHFRDILAQRGLDHKEVTSVIRNSNMAAKTGWLMPLAGLPSLPGELKKRITRVVDLRNCIVHYKVLPTQVGTWGGGWFRLQQRLQELDFDDVLQIPDELEDVLSSALIELDQNLELAVKVYQTVVEST